MKGDPGTKGTTGETGPGGATGQAGKDGAGGQQGASGMNGAAGAAGMSGMRGPPGPPGMTITLSSRATRGFQISPVPLVNTGTLSQDMLEAIGLGSYLVNAQAGCNDCHAHRLPPPAAPQFLAGGMAFKIPLGPTATATVYCRNLTPDPTTGLPHDVTNVDDFITLFRTGKDFRTGHTGESLLVMPWPAFRWMAESDIRAIYAYLTHIPAVSNMVPDDANRPVVPTSTVPTSYDEGDVVRPLPPAMAQDPGNFNRGLTVSPLAEPTGFKQLSPDVQALYARGSYIVNAISGCNDCHTNPPRDMTNHVNTAAYLSGGKIFDVPPGLNAFTHTRRTMGANLTGQNNGFYDGFEVWVAMMTQGVHAENTPPRPLAFPMPWMDYQYMEIGDLEAVFTYVTNVPRRTGQNDKVTQAPTQYCDMNTTCAGTLTCFSPSLDGAAGGGGECYGNHCTTNADCGACQTCSPATGCQPPAAGDPCIANGL